MGSGAKSCMRKSFLKYEEMRRFFPIYEEAVSHIWLCTRSLLISRKIFFSFLSVYVHIKASVLGGHSSQPMPALWARRRLNRHLTELSRRRGVGGEGCGGVWHNLYTMCKQQNASCSALRGRSYFSWDLLSTPWSPGYGIGDQPHFISQIMRVEPDQHSGKPLPPSLWWIF